jgi:hypothetical protein
VQALADQAGIQAHADFLAQQAGAEEAAFEQLIADDSSEANSALETDLMDWISEEDADDALEAHEMWLTDQMLDEEELECAIAFEEQIQDEGLDMHEQLQHDIAAATEWHSAQEAQVALYDTADGIHSDDQLVDLSIAASDEALEADRAAAEQWLVQADGELRAAVQYDDATDAATWAVTDAALAQLDVAIRDAAAAAATADSSAATEWYAHARAAVCSLVAHYDTDAVALGCSETQPWIVPMVATVTLMMQTFTATPLTAAAVTPATVVTAATATATATTAAAATSTTAVTAATAATTATAAATTATAAAAPATAAATKATVATTAVAAAATADSEQYKALAQTVAQRSYWTSKRCVIQ